MVSQCLDDAVVARLLADDVSGTERGAILAHADGCEDCRRLLAEVARPLQGNTSDADMEDTLPSSTAMSRGLRPLPGDVIEHYTVVEVLGQGAMGIVVRARDTVLGRDVALKLLVHSRSEDARRRLVREAQAMAQLSHPNVVTVHAVGRHEHGVYLAMELVPGRTLQQWCDARERPWSAVVQQFLHAGEGLSAAHEVGLVHRDFKPDNVLVRSDGRVMVTDFGLAGVADGTCNSYDDASLELGTNLTHTGAMMGTPRFMAPEQYRDSRDVGAAADQFSFAVALYAALYGSYPFTGEDLDSLRRSVSEGIAAVPPVRVAVPRAVWAGLRRAMQRDPADRYPTMRGLLRDLRRAVDAPARRRRSIAMGAAGGIVLVGGVVLGLGLGPDTEAPTPCVDLGARLVGVWDDDRAQAVAQVLGSADDSDAGHETAQRLRTRLDQYASRWTTVATETCEATHVHGVQPQELLDVRMACLDERRASLSALSRGLVERPASDLLEHAVVAAADLPDVDDCARRRVGVPTLPAAAVEDLSELSTLYSLGAYDEVEQRGAALADSESMEMARARAQLMLVRGRASLRRGDHARASEQFVDVGMVAAEVGDDELIAASRLELITARMGGQLRYDSADTLIEAARQAVRRVGDPPRLQIRLAIEHGSLLVAREAYADALTRFDEALAVADAAGIEELTRARILQGRAINLAAMGRGDEAYEDASALLELRREQLGEHHPLVADARFDVARALMLGGRAEEAETQLQQALTAIERRGGPNALPAADVLLALGGQALERGEFVPGAALIRRALAVLEHHGQQDTQRAFTVRGMLGVAYSMQGRHDEAVREVADMLAARERVGGTDDPAFAYDLSVYAEALARAGRPEESLDAFERLSTLAGEESPLHVVAAAGIAVNMVELGRPGAKAALEQALALELDEFNRGSLTIALARVILPEDHDAAIAMAESALPLISGPDGATLRANVDQWLAENR
ncbi:MAG: protein kinase [Deltaproteobacteria bacterium]|nr:protein kinase [Deltaproteobacteria bacterium]